MVTSKQHEDVLKEAISNYKEKGYTVIDLERKCPDAIAVRNGPGGVEIAAVEILGMQWDNKDGWKKSWTSKAKAESYHMFDKVLLTLFRRGNKDPTFRKEQVIYLDKQHEDFGQRSQKFPYRVRYQYHIVDNNK